MARPFTRTVRCFVPKDEATGELGAGVLEVGKMLEHPEASLLTRRP